MRRAFSLAAAVAVASFAGGCDAGRKGATGFHLPDGDAAHGRDVFVAMKCHACHRVAGLDLAEPVADPPVPVVLGGKVARPRTDGELLTAIVHPSHKLAPGYPREAIRTGNLSRMGEFGDAMTVRELIDVVAFLQSRYEIVPPPPPLK